MGISIDSACIDYYNFRTIPQKHATNQQKGVDWYTKSAVAKDPKVW